MQTCFHSGSDTIRISIEKRPDVPADKPDQFCLLVSRNHCPEASFTRDELHRVLDNARDVLLVVADKCAVGCRGEFQKGGA
jgi:hypothetical protein